MIIGKNKGKVIENIKNNVQNGDFNSKVEVDDPNLTEEQKDEIIARYLNNRTKLSYKIKNKITRSIISIVRMIQDKDIEIKGIENISNIKTGAILTNNHFNPLDSIIIQKLIKKIKKRLYIVGQESNLAMTGLIGFIMNFTDIVPISNKISYMKKDFANTIQGLIENKNIVLIYPEQEMWFNYRKPRPVKPGAYYYAAKNNVPIISCFVEMINTDKKDNEEFYKLKYVLHILPTIYPSPNKTVKENTKNMMEQDYRQKVEAYEKAYNKKLEYDFKNEDIAGWIY